jgi:hypothetical protein
MAFRWAWVAVTAGISIFVSPRQRADPAWLRADGQHWERLSPEAREAYLAGFLAGHALAQALAAGTGDSAGLVQAMDSVVRGELRFPFSPNVYGARIEDFYWWQNHRSLPIWYALWEVNNGLRRSPGNGR